MQALSNIKDTLSHAVLGTTIPKDHGNVMTTAAGAPVGEMKYSLTAGPTGPVLLQDVVLQEKIQYFSKERTPPRNVHALGFGAFGKFTITNDITKYSCAKIFSKVGNTCETFTRFSGVFTERGDADTIRDLRGWATKFYTEDGNWDILCVNTPAFNARDMKVGPDAIHAFKRDPRTGEWNSNQTWDFVATHPEALQTQLMIYTDRVGTPLSFRTQHWFACNTYSMVNAQKERFWVRFHFVGQQGWEGMSRADAQAIAGEDPNYYSREMREAIDQGMFPKWKMCIQVMTEQQGYDNPAIAFDCTKVWKHDDFPLIEIGEIEVNRNPGNYHTTTEVVAFAPHRVVPGIGFSPDKLLQGRLMLYDATQFHRLGTNHQQIPINCPFASKTHNYHTFQGLEPGSDQFNRDVFPAYYPSLFGNKYVPDPSLKEAPLKVDGPADYYPPPQEYTDADIYAQSRDFLKVTTDADRASLIDNLGNSLGSCDPRVVEAILAHFSKIDAAFGKAVADSIAVYQKGVLTTMGRQTILKLRGQLKNPIQSVIEKEGTTTA